MSQILRNQYGRGQNYDLPGGLLVSTHLETFLPTSGNWENV